MHHLYKYAVILYHELMHRCWAIINPEQKQIFLTRLRHIANNVTADYSLGKDKICTGKDKIGSFKDMTGMSN